jgi:hypothetical protein
VRQFRFVMETKQEENPGREELGKTLGERWEKSLEKLKLETQLNSKWKQMVETHYNEEWRLSVFEKPTNQDFITP